MKWFKVIGCDNAFAETFGKVIGKTFCFCNNLNEGRFVALLAKNGDKWIIPSHGVYWEEIMF